MKIRIPIRREVKVVAVVAMISLLIAFTGRHQSGDIITNILVELQQVNENHFVDKSDVISIIEGGQPVLGKRTPEVNLRMLERRLMTNQHIEKAEMYVDVKGNLVVNVRLRRPVARLVQSDGPDAYIAQDGVILPVSEKYSSRVVLVSGAMVPVWIRSENIQKTENGSAIMQMLLFINNDPFWKAQIAQLHVDRSGDVLIYPQVTGQVVKFGKPEGIESKFRKLMIFYKEILPQRGWTRYERVNIEYEGQIIAQ